MMSEIDRKKVFWLLKKYSSYTAWKALGDAYNEFADAWMTAMKSADMRDSTEVSWRSEHTKEILDGKIAFNKGLKLLKHGDRQVFRNNSRGLLNRASNELIFVQKIMNPEEYVHDCMKNKDLAFSLIENLVRTMCGQGAATEFDEGKPAPLKRWSVLLNKHPTQGYSLRAPEATATPHNLSPVPPSTNVIVRTTEEIPFDGIYEPEWSGADVSCSGWIEKLTSDAAFEKASAIEKGCMNYLVSGAKAPLYQDGENDAPMPVTWRLIWKDERYLDGKIPEEEEDYLKPGKESSPVQLRCEGGQPCPRSGYWWTPARKGSRQRFTQGEIMPDYPGSSYGVTIWQLDLNQ
jgi:hypothetical protein